MSSVLSWAANSGGTTDERANVTPGFQQCYGARHRTGCGTIFRSVERGTCGPPSEGVIKRLAEILKEDPDVLLARAGKLSSDLREIIWKRPRLFADLIRQLRDSPDDAIDHVVREVRAVYQRAQEEVPEEEGRGESWHTN